MKHRLLRVVAASAIALGAVAVPSGAATVHAGSRACTGWTNSVTPPTTIRVYRRASGSVDVVPFRTYVERVLASEWGARTAPAAMRAGAITVKQYAWYYAMHWRGGTDGRGHCYDVVDSTRDQLYNPTRRASAEQLAAIEATWWISLRRAAAFYPTGYKPGNGRCLANLDGWHLYQRDAVNCVAKYGDTTERLLRRFISRMSFVTPGTNDVTSDHRGDALLAVTDPATHEVTVRVLSADSGYAAIARRQLTRRLDTATTESVLGRASGDVDGNGRTDLVQLVAVGSSLELRVMLASAGGLAAATTWWSATAGVTSASATDARLVVADFNGDGRADAGIVRLGDTATQLLTVLSKGAAFKSPVTALTVHANLAGAVFAAGDFSGDGRADLLIASPTTQAGGTPATAIRVAAGGRSRILAAPRTWSVENTALANLQVLVADVDRTGRDDAVLVHRASTGSRILVDVSNGSAFRRTWLTRVDLAIPFAATRFSTTDWDGDGRMDLLAYVDLGVDAAGRSLGTAIQRYMSKGTAFTRKSVRIDATLPWADFTAH